MSLLIAAGLLATGTGGRPGPGWLEVDGDTVTGTGQGAAPRPPDRRAAVVVPGFVDLHCHGGGGDAFGADAQASARVAAFHAAHGTTTLLASLVTAPPDVLLRSVHALAPLVQDGVLAGIHLEGPWLARSRCGAHDPALLRDPDPAEVRALLDTGPVAMVTLAPELPGGLDAVAAVAASGVLAAVGHTAADHDLTLRALDAGARVGTHLFNAMPPLGHRDPGPAGALLADPRATVELITDGVHTHPALWEIVAGAAPGRVVAVTDATAAAGMPDGDYRLGGLAVRVEERVSRLARGPDGGPGPIAGSTATADGLFRRIAAAAPGARADAVGRAVAWTATTPAGLLGRDDAGVLRPGGRADVVLLDEELTVTGVLRGGAPVPAPSR